MEMHRIWLGSEMPERYQQYGELWKELNPDYTLHDWTEEEVFDTEWMNKAVLDDLYSNSKKPGADMVAYWTQVADVVDYEILWKYGGWYFNTDLKPIRPLSTIQPQDDPALAMEDDIHPVNMAMFSPFEGHMFYFQVMKVIARRYFNMPGAYMNATTGVQGIQEAIQRYQQEDFTNSRNIIYYPRSVFNPIHFTDFGYGETPDVDREYPEETVAVHEWAHRTNMRGQRVLED